MSHYKPDFNRIVSAAGNRTTDYIPLYEHMVSLNIIEALEGISLEGDLNSGDPYKMDKAFRIIAEFHREKGYDSFSYEGCFTELIQQGKGLTGQAGSLFQNSSDFEKYPWDSLPEKYFQRFGRYFDSIRRTLPVGMKITGGVGNGIFETVQDFIPYTELAYLEIDNPEMFKALWQSVGDALHKTWIRFLDEYSDILAVGRFGDDLGFKSALLICPENIRTHIIPEYKKIVAEVKSRNIPFLLHSCGYIFDVMDDLIDVVEIDAKHSNEDAIAPFQRWVDDYGSRIANFGGLDMDVICRDSQENIRAYIRNTMKSLEDSPGGIAVGSGNQIASYVPPENFTAMVDEIRKIRGA